MLFLISSSLNASESAPFPVLLNPFTHQLYFKYTLTHLHYVKKLSRKKNYIKYAICSALHNSKCCKDASLVCVHGEHTAY